MSFITNISYRGSSPHTWRTLHSFLISSLPCRIISTYVENTVSSLNQKQKKEDHLHIRGEH